MLHFSNFHFVAQTEYRSYELVREAARNPYYASMYPYFSHYSHLGTSTDIYNAFAAASREAPPVRLNL